MKFSKRNLIPEEKKGKINKLNLTRNKQIGNTNSIDRNTSEKAKLSEFLNKTPNQAKILPHKYLPPSVMQYTSRNVTPKKSQFFTTPTDVSKTCNKTLINNTSNLGKIKV